MLASSFYQGHGTWTQAATQEEPEVPTHYVLRAREQLELGRPDAARRLLTQLPAPPWPTPVGLAALDVALALRDEGLYDHVLSELLAHDPDHPGVRFHRFHAQLRRGHAAEALTLLPAVATTYLCSEARSHLEAAARAYPATEGAQLRAAANGLHCAGDPARRAP
jgi:thioredoxin-like negative regulator of GroEL